jgi:hypothetical protein
MFDLITELHKAFRNSKSEGDNLRVGPCPNCGSTLTLSVNIASSNVPIGTFHCWECRMEGNSRKYFISFRC